MKDKRNVCGLQTSEERACNVPVCVTNSFALNIGPNDKDIVLHMNPRFNAHGDENAVVCNSYQEGDWCEEHREGGFPFKQGEEFKVCACVQLFSYI